MTTTTLIFLFFGIILYTFLIMYIGFKVAEIRWNHKEKDQKLKSYETINKELSNVNLRLNEEVKKGNENLKHLEKWYVEQLSQVAMYIKKEYNDSFLENLLITVTRNTSLAVFTEKKELDLDKILDKINQNGFDSLTQDEIEFLKKNKK